MNGLSFEQQVDQRFVEAILNLIESPARAIHGVPVIYESGWRASRSAHRDFAMAFRRGFDLPTGNWVHPIEGAGRAELVVNF